MIRWAITFQSNDFCVVLFSPVFYCVLSHPILYGIVRCVCLWIALDDVFHITIFHDVVIQAVIIRIAAFYVSRTLFLVIIDGVSLFLLLLLVEVILAFSAQLPI
jgi:hypothetical protein